MRKSNHITTILGVLGAIFAALKPYCDNGDFDFERDKYVLLQAAGLAVFSYFVADKKSNKGESHNIPNNEKNNTLAGKDTSIGEGSSKESTEDN
jgi:hypothetical protein